MTEAKKHVQTSDKVLLGVLEMYLQAHPEFARYFARCESPIEQLFLVAIARHAAKYKANSTHFGEDAVEFAAWRSCYVEDEISDDDIIAVHGTNWTIILQQPTVDVSGGCIRPDFAIVNIEPVGSSHIVTGRTAIELDGHDWHERTKEQAKVDRMRDRRLVEAGWTVVRFTGSEVYEDPDGCLLEALGSACGASLRVHMAAMELDAARVVAAREAQAAAPQLPAAESEAS